jgi:hypothetical protein
MSIFFTITYSLGFIAVVAIIRSFVAKGAMHEIHWLLFGSYVAYWCNHILNLAFYR